MLRFNFIALGLLLVASSAHSVTPPTATTDGGLSMPIALTANLTSYLPTNTTSRGLSLQAGKVYNIDISDTTLSLDIAVSNDDPIDPVALYLTFTDTLRIAREKAEAWGTHTYLHQGDDPFMSDTDAYTQCTIELESASKSRRSRQRLKYGRLVLVLRALNTFLYEGHNWHDSVVWIRDNGVLVGRGSVMAHDGAALEGLGGFNVTSQAR